MVRAASVILALTVAACTPPNVATGPREFERWLAEDATRAASFARFQDLLQREGVAEVVESRELWIVDRLAPECVVEAFVAPPEEYWPRIVPALRFIRDYVEPAVGAVTVASSFRDEAFNACVGGASQSAHRGFYALDLVPRDAAVTREVLIERLCPIHARDGRRFDIGLGIYQARRFHIDARGFRGWGGDYRRVTFPCAAAG